MANRGEDVSRFFTNTGRVVYPDKQDGIPQGASASRKPILKLASCLLGSLLFFSSCLLAQTPAVSATLASTDQLQAALLGEWSGVLEYRDYQSDGRVKLPTWLVIDRSGDGLRWRYTYDDGPYKIVQETDTVTLSAEPATWSSVEEGKPGTTKLSVEGLSALKGGRGTLILLGTATENGKPVDTRTTLHVTRNLLEVNKETRPSGGTFQFRDGYTLTRRRPPNP